MTNEEKASGINLPNLGQNKQSIGKIIAKKRMPVSFIKMNNSHKWRHEQMQKKLENIV